jgi:hypothetical protein
MRGAAGVCAYTSTASGRAVRLWTRQSSDMAWLADGSTARRTRTLGSSLSAPRIPSVSPHQARPTRVAPGAFYRPLRRHAAAAAAGAAGGGAAGAEAAAASAALTAVCWKPL